MLKTKKIIHIRLAKTNIKNIKNSKITPQNPQNLTPKKDYFSELMLKTKKIRHIWSSNKNFQTNSNTQKLPPKTPKNKNKRRVALESNTINIQTHLQQITIFQKF